VITPLLRILEKMHSLKLLHRDIKPENIFVTGLGKFRLGDFGLAIKFDEEVPFSRSGTLDYMAPEVRQPSGWKLRMVFLQQCWQAARV
jgi:serine/threonine protein kinase